jgi:chemotaxis protein MotB
MMAFFMLMWLLNATTEKQRKGIADYFNPTIPVNRISGGGDGAFGGDSIFSENTLTKSGTGASAEQPASEDKARGETGTADAKEAAAAEQAAMAAVEKALLSRGGESMTMERLLRHVVTRVTDEGLVIEIFDLAETPLFEPETTVPTAVTRDIAGLLAEVLTLAENAVAVDGYVRTYPVTLLENPTWDLSAQRAQAIRILLEEKGFASDRMSRITGHADRQPATADPTATRNNRIEVILLRKNR